MYEAEYQDYTLLVNAFDYVDEFGIKAIAMDLKKWSTVESEQDWCDRISTFLQFPEILSLERIILFYSESDICQDKLAFSKSMTEDFVTRSDSPLSVIRDDAIRELIQTDERFSSCTVEDWKLPKFDFVLRSEWRQWLGTWADRHDTCLHKIPYIRSLKYRIPGYRCDLERARWRLKGLLRWPWR
ncbi:hypothetical protein DL98DRAFT_516073 [Cadophora sp. DSE1049]|nr:hypothetical protein DL98DRAFT_516073 [Cadophora sp. DSE1049]